MDSSFFKALLNCREAAGMLDLIDHEKIACRAGMELQLPAGKCSPREPDVAINCSGSDLGV